MFLLDFKRSIRLSCENFYEKLEAVAIILKSWLPENMLLEKLHVLYTGATAAVKYGKFNYYYDRQNPVDRHNVRFFEIGNTSLKQNIYYSLG